jgi:fatty acid desaturase
MTQSTTSDTRRPASPSERHASLYTGLARRVREQGLLRRRYAYYWSRIALATVAFGGIWVGFFLLGDSWLQLLLAAALGVVCTQFGFLAHDGAHRQMFVSAAWNAWTARVLGGAFAGLSYGWWRDKHNRHHAAPNQEGRDPDIAPGAIAFTPAAISGRGPLGRWFAARQGWLFFPLLTFEGLALHWASLAVLLRPGAVPHQRKEAAIVLSRLVAYVVVLLLALPPGLAVAFFAVQMGVFGVCLGAAFAPNHKGMPIVPRTMELDFLRRQVLMSRNVRGGLLVDFALGGLNYQIEHHLFPSMPRPNLKLVQPLVREYCARHGVGYTEVGFLASYGVVVDYLNHVGLRARDPFQCPLAAELR